VVEIDGERAFVYVVDPRIPAQIGAQVRPRLPRC
jgi:hypothetical protein